MKKTIVLCILLIPVFALLCDPIPSIEPGRYGNDIVLDMHTLGGVEIQYTFDKTSEYSLFSFPVELTALPGEEREYTIHIREKISEDTADVYSYTYVIDKRPPSIPLLNKPPGLYQNNVSISFLDNKDTIFVSLNGNAFKEWQGNEIILKSGRDQISKHIISSYSRDIAGNVSKANTVEYYIQKTNDPVAMVPVKVHSPQGGVFANYQYLVLEKRKDLDLYYTTDSTVPDTNDSLYTGPVRIEEDGAVIVSVAGYNRSGVREFETQLRYMVSLSEGRMVSRGSGLYESSVQLEPQEPQLVYTLDDTKPTEDSFTFNQPIRLNQIDKGSSVYTLQIAPVINQKVSDIVFRYVYIIDTSIPSQPRFIVNGSLPLNVPGQVTMVGDKTSQLHYTIDGTTPTADSPRYLDSIPVPIEGEQGSFFLRGVAIDGNGKKSEETSIVIPFDTKAPEAPIVETEKIPGGYILKTDELFGTRLLYEISWKEDAVPVPVSASPQWEAKTQLVLPHGMKGSAVIAVARIDEAGNMSEPFLVNCDIDNYKTPMPEIQYQDGVCSITASGIIKYQIFDGFLNSVIGKPLTNEYTEPFSLTGKEGELNEMTVAAYAVDGENNFSNVSTAYITIDKRIPVVPEILNIQNHMVYTTSPIRFKTAEADKDISFHYSVSNDGTEPEDPSPRSPRLENLVIETPEDQEVYYRVKILPVNSATGRTGEIKEFLFAVDRNMPVLPRITGFTEGSVYNRRIGITLEDIGDGNTGYLSITKDGSDPGDPAVFGVPYSDTVYLYPEEDSVQNVRIRVGVSDPAGNTVIDSHEYRFTIDNIPPQVPIVEGLPIDGVSNGPLSLSINSEDSSVVYYRLSREEDWQQQKLEDFKAYTSPVYVDGKVGGRVLYYLEIYAEDAVGNSLQKPARYSFIIDRTETKDLPAPVLSSFDGHVIAEWSGTGRMEYSLDGTSFTPYVSPFVIEKGSSRLYFRGAGRMSSQHIDLPDELNIPQKFYSGIDNGSRQSSKVIVRPGYSEGIIRYEISVDEPSSVSSFSPVFNSNLDFDVPPGLTRRFYINFGYYETEDDLTGASLSPLTFTIDKSPPSVPGIRESIQGMGKTAQKVIQLYGEGTIYYRIVVQGKEGEFEVYKNVLRLDSGSKVYDTFQLQAYAEDSLGNRSALKTWDLIIDQDIVYVSIDGNDYYDGSRLKPVKTIEQAVALAREQQRTTLYVFPGIYPVNRPINIDGLQIVGGYGDNGRTFIQTGEYFSSDYGMIHLSRGEGSISNISFINSSANTKAIIYTKGKLYISNCDFSRTGDTDLIIVQDNGDVTLEQMEITHIGTKGFYRQNGGIAAFSSMTISPQNDDNRETPLLTSLKGKMRFHDVKMYPGAAKKCQGYYGVDSELEISSSLLHSGIGSVSASAIVMINGTLHITESEIHGDSDTRTLSLVDAYGSTVDVRRSYLTGSGRQGAVLLNVSSTNTTVEYSTLNAGGNADFSFGIKASEGSLKVTNSIFKGEFSKDATVMELKDLEGIINHNLIDVNGPSRFTYGIKSNGSKGIVLANTILINRKSAGIAIQSDTLSKLAVENNDIHGWTNYGIIGQSAASDIKAFNNIDNNPLGGGIHKNISEDPARTLRSDGLHLQEASVLINNGTAKYGGGEDLDGDRRPNPNSGIRPLPDIGIDEVYP